MDKPTFILPDLHDLHSDYHQLVQEGMPREAAATLVLAAVVARLETSLWRMNSDD
jgi:hypothetical protein